MDWNKEIEISKKLEIVIYTLLYLLTLGIHYGLSFVWVDITNGWTQMEIFGFLAWMTTMIYIVLIGVVIIKKMKESHPQKNDKK